MDLIKPIKKQLDEQMTIYCNTYISIGTPSETPRYLNIDEWNEEDNILTILSTQVNLGFKIVTPMGYLLEDQGDFWEQFKKYRTAFLKENFPTIETV